MNGIRSAPGCRGIGLVETVIALLILAIGVLGTAGMQLRSLREVQVSYQRSQASILAYEMADLMRANREGARRGAYQVEPEIEPPDLDEAGALCGKGEPTKHADGTPATIAPCTPVGVAAADMAVWRNKVAGASAGDYLFGGATRITCEPDPLVAGECDPMGIHRVTVMWNEDRVEALGIDDDSTSCPDRATYDEGEDGPYNENFLNCFTLSFQLPAAAP